MTLVAGVDSSTQSTKVEIRDLDSGDVVGRGAAAHPPTTDPARPGRSEADPEQWWQALCTAMRTALDDGLGRGTLGRGDAIDALAVAGQQHGMVALDGGRRVIRPAKLWNDTETAPDAGWLCKQLPDGAAAWAEACGSVPVAAFTIAKLSWLHRSEPDAWSRLAHVLLPHDWLTYRMTGELVTDRGEASGTGYWRPSIGDYRFDLLAIVDRERDWTDAVPRVLGAHDRAGTVLPPAVAELGAQLAGAVVAPGTGDNMAVALGTGLAPGDAVLSIGTSVTAFAVSESPVVDPTGAIAGFADATGRHLPLVCLLNGTGAFTAVGRLLGLTDDETGLEEFDDLALSGGPGAGGLTLLPYLGGERTPDLPKATGTLSGLRSDVTREQLARAAVEGVVCAALDALDALRRHVEVTGRVLLVGGGSRSLAVRDVLARLADLPVEVLDNGRGPVESAAAGAAVQAAMALTGDDPADIAARWGLGVGRPVEATGEATGTADLPAVRDAYARLRQQMHGR